MTAIFVSSFPSVRYRSATVVLSTFEHVTLTVSPVLAVSGSTDVQRGNPSNADSAEGISNKVINHVFIGASSGGDYTPCCCAKRRELTGMSRLETMPNIAETSSVPPPPLTVLSDEERMFQDAVRRF